MSGNNSSLRTSLLATLHNRLLALPHNDTSEEQRILPAIAAAIEQGDTDPEQVATLFEQANAWIIAQHCYDGMLLIIDELGQYLNYLYRHNEERDLFVLQSLAERASRSAQTPLLMLTILHQAFDRYATTAGAVQRTEWKKIQGRFVDLPFQEPDSQMMRMVGNALCPPGTDLQASERMAWVERMAPLTEELGLRPTGITHEEWHRLLAQTWRLHPIVLVMLPLLFRHLAQNERSLFSFLTGEEPWSFQDVLRSSQSNGAHDTIYRLPHLFAYIESTMGTGLYSHVHGHRWAELIEALARLHESDQHERQVLTTIGTLNAFGHHHNVRASEQLIAFALQDNPDDQTVLATISTLEQHRHITYRRYRDSYIIWEGSDLDLDGLLQDTLRRMSDRTDVARLLQQTNRKLPIVARQHSYHTGAVRHFAVRYVSVEDLSATVNISDKADGEILYVVPTDDEALQEAQQWAASAERTQEDQRIVVIPNRIQHINELLLEVAALQQIIHTQPELENDRVAHREISSRLVEAQQALDEAVNHAYHPRSSAWWWCGNHRPLQSMRQLDDVLSEVCDTVYSSTPRIKNELIVRRHLPSASAKARRNLIEAMLFNGHIEDLALAGYPPEKAIYESVLKASGIHRQQPDGTWGFAAPDEQADKTLNLIPVWNAMQEFIAGTQQKKQPITHLFAEMEARPYGVKAGLVPVLFMAMYLAHAGEIALYEHGSYVTIPDIAVFERLVRHPEYFSLRQFQTVGARMKIYEHLANVLAPDALTRDIQPALLDAVNPLLRFVKKLPEYSQQTKNVSAQARAIRTALLGAQEPDIVLFETLARACGFEPFTGDELIEGDSDQIASFFAELRTGIQELQRAYSDLIQKAAMAMHKAFAAQSPAQERQLLYEELRRRIRPLIEVTSDNQLRTLGIRLEHASAPDAWIESVGELVIRKPMSHWRDADLDDFKVQIADLGRRFCTSEKIATATKMMPTDTHALHISFTDAQGEHSRVIWNGEHDPAIQEVQTRIDEVLEHYHYTDEQKIRVLTEVLRPLLEYQNESESDHE